MAAVNEAYIHSIGLASPGLPDWSTGRTVLRGEAPYSPETLKPHRSTLLPRNEARRAGACVRLALQAAEQVCKDIDPRQYATVFASANGDLGISDRICEALLQPERAVSPTQFHNSVHNAAAGYWSIATGSQAAANSIAGGPDSFAVALREAWAQLSTEKQPVLLVCFEAEGGGKLETSRPPIYASFAMALALSTESRGALACLQRPSETNQPPTTMAEPGLERLRQHNPPARSLPLLETIARGSNDEVVIESSQGNLSIPIHPPT